MNVHFTRSLFAAAFCVLLAGTAQAQGTWSMKAPSPLLRSVVAVVEIGGKLYEVGGETFNAAGQPEDPHGSPLLQEYDPVKDAWRDLPPMPVGLSHPGAAALNGKLYVAGGFTIGPPSGPRGGHFGAVDSFFVYDPMTNRWQTLAPLSNPRGSVGLAAVAGKIHAVGGRGEDQNTVGTHEIYDPATGKWTPAPPLPTPRDHFGIAVLDGRIHVVGGRTGEPSVNLAQHEIFDPATGQWTQAAPLPTARSGNTAAAYRGLVIYAGGECKGARDQPFNERKTFDENEAFDPKTGKWITLARFPGEGLQAFGAASAGDSLYFLGGTHGCGGNKPSRDVLVFKLP